MIIAGDGEIFEHRGGTITIKTAMVPLVTFSQSLCSLTTHDDSLVWITITLDSCCLEIKFKLKVSLIKLVNSNISVLSSTSVATSVWVKLYRVDGSKMAFYSSELLLKDGVEEPGLELAHLGAGGCHIHGVLLSKQKLVFLVSTNQ